MFLKWERGQEMEKRGWREGKGMKKGIQLYYVHVSTPHEECKHYALQHALIKTNIKTMDMQCMARSFNIIK